MFVVAIDACPSQAWTVTGSTPLASERQQLPCWRRSWIRRPRATLDHAMDLFTAEACSWCPVRVVSSRSSGPFAGRALPARAGGSGRPPAPVAAFPDLVDLRLTALRSSPADQQDPHRHPHEVADPRLPQLDERRPVHPAISRTSADVRLETHKPCRTTPVSSANGRISVRRHLATFGTVPVTGLTRINRSRTAQARNEGRRGFVSPTTRPDRIRGDQRGSLIGYHTDLQGSQGRRCQAEQGGVATYVFRDTSCSRCWSHSGSRTRRVRRPARGSTPPSIAARSRATQVDAASGVEGPARHLLASRLHDSPAIARGGLSGRSIARSVPARGHCPRGTAGRPCPPSRPERSHMSATSEDGSPADSPIV